MGADDSGTARVRQRARRWLVAGCRLAYLPL
jgi:hypothetical protein